MRSIPASAIHASMVVAWKSPAATAVAATSVFMDRGVRAITAAAINVSLVAACDRPADTAVDVRTWPGVNIVGCEQIQSSGAI